MYRYSTITTAAMIAMLFLASVEGRSEYLLDRFKREAENVYDKQKEATAKQQQQQPRRLRRNKGASSDQQHQRRTSRTYYRAQTGTGAATGASASTGKGGNGGGKGGSGGGKGGGGGMSSIAGKGKGGHDYTVEDLNSRLKGILMEDIFNEEDAEFFGRKGGKNNANSMPVEEPTGQVRCFGVVL